MNHEVRFELDDGREYGVTVTSYEPARPSRGLDDPGDAGEINLGQTVVIYRDGSRCDITTLEQFVRMYGKHFELSFRRACLEVEKHCALDLEEELESRYDDDPGEPEPWED